MARPHLRKRPLHFVCVDRAPKPMRLGLDTLTHMAAAHGGLAPWRITLVKAPLDARLREKADMVIMANALNEVLHRGEGELLEEADALSWHLTSMLNPGGAMLVVEPGVRPSAHLLAALRRGFLHRGLKPLAPCPHTGPCPMSGRGYTAWCHFNFDAEIVPNWLKKLSDEARLTKDNVSLSFLHFSSRGRALEAGEGKSFVRAMSGPFELPGEGLYPRYGQYCCSDRGLTLLSLPRKHLVPLPGSLLEATWPETPETDSKSGALILPIGKGDDGTQTKPRPAPEAAAPTDDAATKPVRKPRLPSERPKETTPRPKPRSPMTPGAKPASKPSDKAAPKAGGKSAPKRVGKATSKPSGKSDPGSGKPARPKKDSKGRAGR